MIPLVFPSPTDDKGSWIPYLSNMIEIENDIMDLGPRLLGYGYIGPCIVRVRVSISWVFNIETMGSLSKRSKSVEKNVP